MLAGVVGVLDEALAGLHQRHHRRRDATLVDEVVEHGRDRGVVQVVAAVVHDHQRIDATAALVEAGGQIDRVRCTSFQRTAVHDQLAEGSGRHAGAWLRPRRLHVAGGLAHRVGAEGMAGVERVERVLDQVDAEAVGDVQLVLEPRARRDCEREQPPLAVGQRLEAQVGPKADAEVGEANGDHRTVECEGAESAVDDRERCACLPASVEGGRCERGGWRAPRHQLNARVRPGLAAHGAHTACT